MAILHTCLATTEFLICESKKTTFGSPATIFSSKNLSHLLTYKGLQTLPTSWVLSLQVAIVKDAILTFQSCPPLNISNLLSQPNTDHSPSHSYIEPLVELLPHASYTQEGTSGCLHQSHRWEHLFMWGDPKSRLCYGIRYWGSGSTGTPCTLLANSLN